MGLLKHVVGETPAKIFVVGGVQKCDKQCCVGVSRRLYGRRCWAETCNNTLSWLRKRTVKFWQKTEGKKTQPKRVPREPKRCRTQAEQARRSV